MTYLKNLIFLIYLIFIGFLFTKYTSLHWVFLTISSKKSPTSISRGWIAFLFSWNCFKNMI